MELLSDKYEYVIIQFDDKETVDRISKKLTKKYEILDEEKHIMKIYTKTRK